MCFLFSFFDEICRAKTYGDDRIAALFAVHAREADAARRAVGVAQDARADHHAVLAEQLLERLLGVVRRQVREVEVRGVLVLLLRHLRVNVALAQRLHGGLRRLGGLEVDEAVALALVRCLI